MFNLKCILMLTYIFSTGMICSKILRGEGSIFYLIAIASWTGYLIKDQREFINETIIETEAYKETYRKICIDQINKILLERL